MIIITRHIKGPIHQQRSKNSSSNIVSMVGQPSQLSHSVQYQFFLIPSCMDKAKSCTHEMNISYLKVQKKITEMHTKILKCPCKNNEIGIHGLEALHLSRSPGEATAFLADLWSFNQIKLFTKKFKIFCTYV